MGCVVSISEGLPICPNMSFFVSPILCTRISLNFNPTLGGGDVNVYFNIFKRNLAHKLVLLYILGFTM